MPCPISLPTYSRPSTSRTFSCVLYGCEAALYMYVAWWATWLLCPYWPIRTSRASVISWMTPP